MTAGLTGYENMKQAAQESGSGIHKGAAEGAVERRRKKLVGKSSWFKSSPKQKASRVERPGKRKIGVVGDKPLTPSLRPPRVQRSGCTVRQLLIRSNPWGQGHCGRPEGECPPCETADGKQNCQFSMKLWECIRIRRRLQEQTKGEVRLLNSKSEYSRCSLLKLVVEGTEGIESDDKKEDEGEPSVNDREIEPPTARSESISGLSLNKE